MTKSNPIPVSILVANALRKQSKQADTSVTNIKTDYVLRQPLFREGEVYPTNAVEWWVLLSDQWDNILFLANKYLGDRLREIWADSGNTVLESMIRFKKTRNPEIARILYGIWMEAPDHPGIHADAGFDTVCDLLSEEYVLYERGEQ